MKKHILSMLFLVGAVVAVNSLAPKWARADDRRRWEEERRIEERRRWDELHRHPHPIIVAPAPVTVALPVPSPGISIIFPVEIR